MKRRYLFILTAVFMLLGSRAMAQVESGFASANLNGIWQMCFYVSGNPEIPGELKPSNSFKILSDDGKFTNMVMIPNRGAIIIGSGTTNRRLLMHLQNMWKRIFIFRNW